MRSHPRPRRAAAIAAPLAALLLVLPGCSSSKHTNSSNAAGGGSTPSPTSSADRVKLAKTKFALNAGLAGGATYQWIYKPFKAGTFKKGAQGRTAALVKGGLAGLFTYNRLKAALNDAKGDPTLSKLTDPLSGSVDKLKSLGSKVKDGSATDADYSSFTNTVDQVKGAASKAGVNVTNQVPSASQLTKG